MVYLDYLARVRIGLLLSVLCVLNVNAEDATPTVEVLAVEYPPFTSEQVEGNGVNFTLLEHRIGKHFTLAPLFLPPARAQQLLSGEDWCLSFYPRPKGATGSHQIRLSEKDVILSLAHLDSDVPTTWQDLTDLNGYSLAVLRTSANNMFLSQFTDAGMHLVQVETVEKSLQMVLKSRADFALVDSVSLNYIQQQNPDYAALQMATSEIKRVSLMVDINTGCRHYDEIKRLLSTGSE